MVDGGLIRTALLFFGPGQYSTCSEYPKKAVRWGSGELDDQLLFNATLFWNDDHDLQLTSLEPDENGLVSASIRNAADAVTRGFGFGPALGADGVYVGRPRAFGMTLTQRF